MLCLMLLTLTLGGYLLFDKYDRILDEGTGPCNLGRVVYHDKVNKRFIKIFHPGYCRLKNFEDALPS